MFPNLDAEQARHGKTNADMAVLLKLSGTTSYENKKKNGNFSVSDAIRMCDLFDCDYEYLFAKKPMVPRAWEPV